MWRVRVVLAGWTVVRLVPHQLSAQAPSTIISDHRAAAPMVARCLTDSLGRRAYRDFEPSAAVDPRDPSHLVAVWVTSGGGRSLLQSSTSRDGGRHWSGPIPLPMTACTGGPTGATRASDPWVTIAPDGAVYAAGIGFTPNPAEGPDPYNALMVSRSDDGGRSFGPAAIVAVSDTALGITHDNVALAVDPSQPRRVILVTTRYAATIGPKGGRGNVGPIGLSLSEDGGRSWTTLRPIGPAPIGGRVSAPVPTIDASGVIRLAYYRADERGHRLGMLTSTDHGVTWSSEVTVGRFAMGRYQADHPATGSSFVFAVDVVGVAVDPSRHRLYLGYADARRDTTGSNGVSLVWSDDGGKRWSLPIEVSHAGVADGWLPALAVDGRGVLGVGYLTAPFAKSTVPVPVEYHLARFRPTRAGVALLDDRVVERGDLVWPGDYHALVVADGRFVLVSGRSTVPSVPADSTNVNPTEIFARRAEP